MKKKVALVLLCGLLISGFAGCSGDNSDTTSENTLSKSESSNSDSVSSNSDSEPSITESTAIEKVRERLYSEFSDTQAAEGTTSSGSVLYVTSGNNEDSYEVGTALGEMSVESWFKYDYVFISQFIDGRIGSTTILDCNSSEAAAHVWYDTSGNLVGDYTSENAEATPEPTTTFAATPTPTATPEPTQEVPLEYQNALSKAHDYLDFTAFSYTGLIDQLEYEGYSAEACTYAADNCGADWNEQAAKKAQDYLDFTSFSRQGLIDQLIYEGFTAEQAEYGVSAVGY